MLSASIRKQPRFLIMMLLALILGFGLVGCSGGSDPAAPGGGGGGTGGTPAANSKRLC